MTTIKERPILFSTPMVQAILAGNKTMTRRVVKGPALEWLAPGMFTPDFVANPENKLCPYGQVGDRLWVRETWVQHTRGKFKHQMLSFPSGALFLKYKADGKDKYETGEDIKWRPSIHMPRAASRLVLEIIGIRVERLQDISEDDAREEGVYFYGYDDPAQEDYKNNLEKNQHEDWGLPTAKASYQSLWQSINGADSWAANPWVWVVEFRRVES